MAKKGEHLTEEIKKKLSEANLGQRHSMERRRKQSEARKLWHETHQNPKKGMRIQFCRNGHNTFVSLRDGDGACILCKKEHAWKKIKNEDGTSFKTNDYNRHFQIQGGRCKLCGKHQTELTRTLCVDHDHKTGEFRWLLCACCNHGLGLFMDNPDVLENAARHLRGLKELK